MIQNGAASHCEVLSGYCRFFIHFIALFLGQISAPVFGVHGTAITIRPNENTEIVVTYDPMDVPTSVQDYMNSPYGFMREALASTVANEGAFRGVEHSATVFIEWERLDNH